jgi:hypothetical protein
MGIKQWYKPINKYIIIEIISISLGNLIGVGI